MDKYEYNLKIDQIRQAIEERDIEMAVQVADEIDWRKEKDATVLTIVADAYELNRDYRKAKTILLMAYEKTQAGRNIAYRLALLSAKVKEFGEAEEFYRDFVEMAPRDTSRYILRYKISKAKGVPVDKLISILEEYVDIDMEEKWMYELAKLYHLVGDEERCVDLCDEMSLWFNHGEYVRKAMDLKKKYRPLTRRQEESYRKADGVEKVEPVVESIVSNKVESEEEKALKKQNTMPFTTLKMNEYKKTDETIPYTVSSIINNAIQGTSEKNKDDIVDSTNQIMEEADNTTPLSTSGDMVEVQADVMTENSDKSVVAQMNDDSVQMQSEENSQDTEEVAEDKSVQEEENVAQSTDNATKVDVNTKTVEIPNNIDIDDIKLKPMEGDGSDTIDLQAVIAQNIQAIMDTEDAEETVVEKREPDKLSMTLDPLYKYDVAGQIGLNIEEPKKDTKQITGQLSIEDVLKNLEERGILKSDTVNKTFETMDLAAEAVEKATEEVAREIEEKKKNETVVEEIVANDIPIDNDMSGVKSALESYADDTVKGFVFTEEIDSEAIEQALLESEKERLAKLEGAPFVEPVVGSAIANTSDVQVSKVTIEVPKIEDENPNKVEEPAKEEIAQEELQEETVENDATDKVEIADEQKASVEDKEDFIAKELAVEKGKEDILAGDTPIELAGNVPILDLDFATPVKKIHPGIAPATTATRTNTADLRELFAGLDEATRKEIGLSEDEYKPINDKVSDESKQIEENKQETVISEEQKEEVALEGSKQEDVTEEKVPEMEIPKKKTYGQLEDMPQVTVTTNKNLTKTASLNIDQIVVTDEEMKPFDSFKTVNGLEQKIKDSVATLAAAYKGEGHSKTGNIMILGDEKSGKTTMAIELIKLINKKRMRNGRRIAKVDSSVLNTRGIRSSMKKLIGSDLIVENAQHLRKNVLNEFVSISNYYTDDMLIVFEGETSALKTMRKENDDIAKMFDHIMVIKEYDVKEWVAYAKKYAAGKNYMIDEMGILALYKSIDDFYGRHQGIDQSDVEGIINDAIKKASSKVTRKLTNLFSGKNDENGMDIIKEADFK